MAVAEGNFCRILTLLRKERGITQKQAAASLGVSQALLSHYEKGVRECGLDFVVRAADFYGVSCDYLLGRSADRSGLTLTVDELPDDANAKDNRVVGSVLATLNKKLITNSLGVLYSLLQKIDDKELTGEVSSYLMCAVYRMFRRLYSANPKNQSGMFSVSGLRADGLSTAAMARAEADIAQSLSAFGEQLPHITTESLSSDYPMYASSLLTVIQHTEKSIGD